MTSGAHEHRNQRATQKASFTQPPLSRCRRSRNAVNVNVRVGPRRDLDLHARVVAPESFCLLELEPPLDVLDEKVGSVAAAIGEQQRDWVVFCNLEYHARASAPRARSIRRSVWFIRSSFVPGYNDEGARGQDRLPLRGRARPFRPVTPLTAAPAVARRAMHQSPIAVVPGARYT